MMIFNPQNWYWIGPLGIFSSASNSIVTSHDSDYSTWQGYGNKPTPWPKDTEGNQTYASLDEVLNEYGLSTGMDFPNLQRGLIQAAKDTSQALTSQIMKTSTHDAAFYHASAVISGNGGVIPSGNTKLLNLANLIGSSPEAFASLATVFQGASFDNLAALLTLQESAGSATTVSELQAALTNFEAAIGNIITEIGSAGVTVTSPPAIVIKGITQ